MTNFYLQAIIIYVCLIGFIYLFFRTKKTTAVVDTCWSLGHWVIGLWLLSYNTNQTIYNTLTFVALSLWAFRLSGYVYFTRVYNTKHVEKRYDELLKKQGQSFHRQFLKQIILQVTMIYVLMAPFYFSLYLPLQIHPILGITCGIIFLFGWINEAYTDWQRHQFRKSNTGILQKGWWQLSRHPNYFFELVMWFSFATIAITQPFGLIAFISPLLLLILMLKITIPVTETYALKNNPKAYKNYQHSTSKLVPLFKRSN